MRGGKELPPFPLPEWIRVRLKTIDSMRELKRLLRTEYIGKMAHPAWRAWAAPRDLQPPETADRTHGRGPVVVMRAGGRS